MAWTQVILKNPLHEGAKQAPVGKNSKIIWTTLFFGIFPALFRGVFDPNDCVIIQTIFALITWGLSLNIFCICL